MGVFELRNPEGRGAHAVSEFKVEGGSKKRAFRHGVWIFSEITQCRRTCIYSHRFSPSIAVYFSVGEKRQLETDLHL